jgi:poly(A) polymerase
MRAASHLLPAISAERKRDELFRMLDGPQAGTCMRALEMLGIFPHFLPELSALKGLEQPAPHVHDAWEHTLRVMGNLAEMLDLLLEGKVKESDGLQASVLTLGIGRHRERMKEYFSVSLNADRSLRALLQFAALLHDIGKPATQSRGKDGRIHFIGHEKEGATLAGERARQLNLSNAEVDWIHAVISNHLRFFFLAYRMEAQGQAPTRRAIYRFFRDAGTAGVGLILLGLADLRGTRDHLLNENIWSAWVSVARLLLENLWEKPEEAVAPVRLLDGNEVMKELALQPGPAIGQLLEAIREAQAAGTVLDRGSALDFARDWTAHRGGGSTV